MQDNGKAMSGDDAPRGAPNSADSVGCWAKEQRCDGVDQPRDERNVIGREFGVQTKLSSIQHRCTSQLTCIPPASRGRL